MSPRDAPTPRAGANARLGLAIVCAGSLVGPLDTTVNTAFPVITAAFALAPHEIQWVVVAFVLAQLAVTLVFGRLGDLFGHRRVFAAGLLACAAAHLAVAWAPDFATMVAMRAFQGLAVGIVVACSVALATQLFPPEAKASVVAVYVMATSLAMGLGPWIGGLLLQAFGWPGVFWFRAPLVLAVLALLPLARPLAPAAPHPQAQAARFDWAGAVGLMGALSLAVLGFAESARPQGSAPLALAGLAGGALLAVAFVRHASRSPHPIIRMEPFRDPRFTAVQLGATAIACACFANLLLLPYVLTRAPGASIATAGLLLSLYPGGSVIGAYGVKRLPRHVGPGALMSAGAAVAALGLGATAAGLQAQATVLVAAGMLLAGIGTGLHQVGYLDSTTSMLPAHERGVAGSLVSVMRLLGVVLGASGISWLNARMPGEAATFAVLGALLALAAAGLARLLRGWRPAPAAELRRRRSD